MAAADYYGQPQHAGPSQAPARPPSHQQPPQQNMLNPNPPYPVFDGPPPPYSAYADHPRPHSQPPPQQRPPVNNQYRPPPPANGPPPTHAYPSEKTQAETHAYPPEKTARQVNNMYRPSDFGGAAYPPPGHQPPPQQQYLHPQQPQGYFPLAGTPAMAQVYGNGNGYRPSTTPGYRPQPQLPYRDDNDYRRDDSRARSRSRSRSRHRKHHHHHDRPQVQQKKSSSAKNTFLGAGGGAILGDAIFPGLGTLSGAILGGLGGHEYTKRRTTSNPNRVPRSRSYSNDYDYGDSSRGRRH